MSALILSLLRIIGIIVVLEAQAASLIHACRRIIALCFLVSGVSYAKVMTRKNRRSTYTSSISWRGEVLAVEDTVGAEMARICVLASIGHDLDTIAINEAESIREEPITAFSSTAASTGAGDDSLLALQHQSQHDVSRMDDRKWFFFETTLCT